MKVSTVAAIVVAAGVWQAACGQTIDPFYAGCYTVRDLGTPAGVPSSLGGVNFLPGDPNTMLISGASNQVGGAVYRIGVVRNAFGNITGFSGTATLFATAQFNDGGLAVGPLNTLFVTTYPRNELLQIPAGAAVPGSTLLLSGLGVASSVGTCQFVPSGFPGEGRLKVLSYSAGYWYDLQVSNPVNGVFTVTRPNTTEINIGGGPEGLVFIGAGNPGFPRSSCAVCEYPNGRVVTYELDANGDAVPSTRRVFITGLSGVEGGVRDPVTGSFLFSTYGGGNRVVVVDGFNLDCRANFNADCSVDFFDYLDFLVAFTSGTLSGDFNHDGVVDLFDYLDFVQAFSSGC